MNCIYRKAKRVIALAIIVGALPFVFNARAYAKETTAESPETKVESKWLDDYKKPVGLTYGAQATIQTTYMWRGLYAGGANIQVDANVGYGGLYADVWWNVGVTDWTFHTFQPELDLSLGFKRWGLNVRYTISSKIPLTFVWATRVGASDGYINEKGELVHAHSSYAEINYTQALPYDLSLYGAIGISPWKSVYSGYQQSFVVNNIELSLRKDWSVSTHCGIALKGDFYLNPSALAHDKTTAEWHPKDPGRQAINANIGMIVYLK